MTSHQYSFSKAWKRNLVPIPGQRGFENLQPENPKRPGSNERYYQMTRCEQNHPGNDGLSEQPQKYVTFSAQLDKMEQSLIQTSSKIFNCSLTGNKFWEFYHGVVNLSKQQLTLNEITILGKGLKFCPTPNLHNHGPLKENIDSFFRSVSLELFFLNNEYTKKPCEDINIPFEDKELKLPSKLNPVMPSNLEHVYHTVVDRILSHNPSHKRKCNITGSQYSCLLNLGDDQSIVIKKADKGSNIVIMDKEAYISEGIRQLF